jgi:ABC-type transport system involved in cytochrome c biogenesis permease subunit
MVSFPFPGDRTTASPHKLGDHPVTGFQEFQDMRLTRCLILGLAATMGMAAAPRSIDEQAYETLGALAVQHQGRRKPLDTLARETVQQIHGSSVLVQRGPRGEKVATWPAVAAVFDWSVRPEYWNSQAIILVEPLQLREALLTDTRKVAPGQRWLSPDDLEGAIVTAGGNRQTFPEWVDDIASRDRAARARRINPTHSDSGAIVPVTFLETKAMETAERLLRYRALRDRNGHGMSGLEIEVVPRPANGGYLAFTRAALLNAPRFTAETLPAENLDPSYRQALLESTLTSGLDAFEVNVVEAFAAYIDTLKIKDRFLPGTNPNADSSYLSWLDEKAGWLPIRFLLDVDPNELGRAGYDIALVEAFRRAFRTFEAAERAGPGRVSRDEAAALVAAARALGTSAGKQYPSETAIAHETHYNRVAPFYWAPWAYGIALVLLVISTAMTGTKVEPPSSPPRRVLHRAGLAALGGGIALECYGFALRVTVSGWAPVTNMYETVVWVALVAAVFGLGLELIARRSVAALAASAVALLASVLAASAPEKLLDPKIKGLAPVLRSNYWLTLHVLTIVSSYAAFALAMGLGLLGVGYYLTATYRRPAPLGRLAFPLLPCTVLCLPYLLLAGHSPSHAGWVSMPKTIAGDVAGCAAIIGGFLTLMSTVALTAEAANRAVGGRTKRSHADRARVEEYRLAMHPTATWVKPISRLADRAIQLGVILVAVGTFLGGVWADSSWGRFWGWDPKEVWALITLLVYLVPLHGRFAGWVGTFGLLVSAVVCFGSVLMAWYGVNFVLGVGLHSYGFSEGGGQGAVVLATLAVLAVVCAAAWRRKVCQSGVATE